MMQQCEGLYFYASVYVIQWRNCHTSLFHCSFNKN